MKILGLSLGVLLLGATVARAEDDGKVGMSKSDTKFMENTAQAGMAEVQISKIAVEKAAGEKAKTFAQHMIDDHTKANEELTQLAQQKSVTLPVDIDAAHKQEIAKLEKLSGAEFDKAYLKVMKSDHEKVVASFKKESKNASDPDLKAWAAKTLPALEAHLDMVKKS